MVTWYYFIVFLFSLFMAGKVLLGNKKVDTMLIVTLILLMLNCMGRFIVALSRSLDVALLANKMIYLGACYLPFVMVLFLSRLCNLKMHWAFKGFLALCSTTVMGFALTVGKSDLYYKHVELARGNGYSYLVKEYGPWHNLYFFLTAFYVLIMLFYVVYAIRRRRQISRRLVITIGGIGCFVFGVYILERVAGIHVSLLTIGYLIGIIFVNRYFEYIDMYDMSSNIYNSIEKMKEYGYIAFDNKYQYVNANGYIMELFPEINDWTVDKKVPESDSYVYKEVISYLLQWNGEENTGKYIMVSDAYFQLNIRHITYGKKKNVGYLLEFVDRTMEKRYYNTIEEYNADMEKEVEEKTKELIYQQKRTQNLFMQTITALSEAVDAKDRYTSGHSKRVAEYGRMIAARMGKSKEELEEIYCAGLLHDVGKIRIPNEIINKPGKLTDEEYNIIKIHSITGFHILRGISDSSMIAIGAKYHHERYDGKGYPNGLEGNMIPEVARIMAVADSYDAMSSNRSYRKALPQAVVRKEIEKGKGTQFDPDIADIMLQMIEEDKEYNMKQTDALEKKILVVDDEVMNHKIIEHIMKDEPMYAICSVNSGLEALALLREQEYDLILLDVRMPGMDGLETLRHIREKYQTPVALMTGDKSLETASEFADLGCDDYITKPFLPMLIKEVVHNMTERTHIED